MTTTQIAIGIAILLLGVPIGNYLAKHTKEELKVGQAWFKIIIILCVIGSVGGLIARNDVLFFGFLFIAIVTSRSLNFKKK
ncbi:MAG: hypothetical protein ACE5ES_04000 [Candidatus Nanoarchaeia archaeon]